MKLAMNKVYEGGVKQAQSWLDAYNNAKNNIYVFLKYNAGSGSYLWDEYTIPKVSVGTNKTISRGYYYNSSINFATDFYFSTTSAGASVYKNTTAVSDKTLYFYYD